MSHILITGGAGFIGSHLAEYYALKGDRVVVIDNLSRSKLLGAGEKYARFNWEYLEKHYKNIQFVRADIRDQGEVERWVRDAEVMIHCAAQTAVTVSLSDPRSDFDCNVQGTFNLLESARRSGRTQTVIFCSTNKVYGENINNIKVEQNENRYFFSDEMFQKGIPEGFPVDHCAHTPYGCSKLAADLYMQDYSHHYGLKTGVFRMSCIYGTRQFGLEDQGWVAHFVIASILGQPISIYGDGKQVRDILHVSDLVRAFDCFVQRGKDSEVFNLGGGYKNTFSLLELLNLLEELLEKRIPVSFKPWRPSDQKVYISDISKVTKKLGWKPKVSPVEGVEDLVRWVIDNKRIF